MKNILNKVVMVGVGFCLVGCDPEPLVGGPCEYADFEEVGVVKAVHDKIIVIEASGIDEVSKAKLTEEFKVGDKVKVKSMQITEGSCNPYNIHSVEKIKD